MNIEQTKVIVEKFFNTGVDGNIALYEESLGLQQENLILDAQSDDPKQYSAISLKLWD